MARLHIFMCILHCIMAVGRLVVQFLEALCTDLDKVLRARVQSVLDGARTGIRLGYAASPDGEEVHRLLRSSEQVQDAACLDAMHPGGRVVLEKWELLRQLHRTYHYGPPPHCRWRARGFREHVAPKSGSHYLLFLEEGCDDVLAALPPHGMAMMRQDIVESVNKILKVGNNDHSDRGGGCTEHPTVREAFVVAQVWEWWFLQFDPPLHTRGVPHRTSCVISSLMGPIVQPPPPIPIPCSPPPLAFLQHGRKRRRGDDCQEQRTITSKNGMLMLVFVCIVPLCVLVIDACNYRS